MVRSLIFRETQDDSGMAYNSASMSKLKLLSLNTYMGGIVGQPLYDFVIAQQPDILFLQEVYSGTDQSLEPRFRSQQLFESLFPTYHSYFSAIIGDQREKEGLLDNGNLTLSQWPLIQTEMVYFDKPYAVYDHDATTDYSPWPSGAQRTVAQLGAGTHIQLINLHGPVWMNGAEKTERRLKMAAVLDRLLSTSQPTIIAGDSNMTPENPSWSRIAAPFQSAFGSQLRTTFNMKRKTNPGYATAAVDVCLVSPEFTVRSAQCLDVDVSDHLPLVVELEL